MTAAKASKSTLLKVGDGAGPEVFTTIAEITTVGEIGTSADEIDATNMDSTMEEFIAGMVKNEEISFEANWLGGNTQQQAMQAGVGTTKNFKVQMGSNNGLFEFAALIKKFSVEAGETKGKQKCKGTIKPSGAITYTAPV